MKKACLLSQYTLGLVVGFVLIKKLFGVCLDLFQSVSASTVEIFSWPPGQLYFSYVFMSRQSLDSWIRGRGLDPLAGMTHTPSELLE